VGADERAAGESTVLDATAEKAAADVPAADAATEEAPADVSETDPTVDEDEERGQADLLDETAPPVPEISPSAPLAFDTAGARATGTGGGPGAGRRTDRRPRRRGFWARLFAGWLVPEESMNRAAAEHFEEVIEEPLVELDEQSTETQPPAQLVALPPVPTTETPGTGAERADRRADDEPESAEQTPEVPPQPESTPEEPEAPPEEAVAEPTPAIDREGARAVLEETLDALGSAHHRPYSRS
jgi:hypothetical protein